MADDSPPQHLNWRQLLRDERGANTFVVLSLCFILIMLTPIFVDFANLHFTRRVTQTGIDAAALAAAIEYTQVWYLSQEPHCGSCTPPGGERIMETEEYIEHILRPMATNESIGRPFAEQYAAKHRVRMLRYVNTWPYHDRNKVYYKEGIPIYPLAIYVKGDRPTDMSYQDFYGGPFRTTAQATAQAYLKRVPWAETYYDCPGSTPENPLVYHCAKYQWQVRLIRWTD